MVKKKKKIKQTQNQNHSSRISAANILYSRGEHSRHKFMQDRADSGLVHRKRLLTHYYSFLFHSSVLKPNFNLLIA